MLLHAMCRLCLYWQSQKQRGGTHNTAAVALGSSSVGAKAPTATAAIGSGCTATIAHATALQYAGSQMRIVRALTAI